jgi:K+-transporting ATPase ATPase C chain
MLAHLRANLLLLILTVLICCVLYPLALWGVGKAFFPTAAEGSLIRDAKGTVVGSRLIGQPFTDNKYFWPRPSAVSWNAAASGGSNLAASNPLLRDRVARQLGPMVRKMNGERAWPDIVKWFRENPLVEGKKRIPGVLERWADSNPTLAGRWVKDDANEKAASTWLKEHRAALDAWRKKNPDKPEPDVNKVKDWPDSLAVEVLKSFAAANPRAWPVPAERKGADGKPEAYFKAETPTLPLTAEDKSKDAPPASKDLSATLFDYWLQKNPKNAELLKKVPADMVMASGSGLDPHITLKNARDQLEDHVLDERVRLTGKGREAVREQIEGILRKHAFRPLAGLGGAELVNVLEVNLALDAEVK